MSRRTAGALAATVLGTRQDDAAVTHLRVHRLRTAPR